MKLACIQTKDKSVTLSYLYVIVHEATGIGKVRVLGVDIGQLDSNQVVNLKEKDELITTRMPINVLLTGIKCEQQVRTISLVTGSLFLSNEVTTSTMASWSFGNLSNSCRDKTICIIRFTFNTQITASTSVCVSVFLTCVL